jgi:uncharacterized membrane protein
MKKQTVIISLSLLAVFVFSTCHSGLSITKRRYNKGYYVQHGQKATQRNQSDHVKTQTFKMDPEALSSVKVDTESAQNKTDRQPIVTIIPQEKQESKQVRKAKNQILPQSVTNVSQNLKAGVFEARKQLNEDPAIAGAGEKFLDLVWVIIIVLLVLYLLGLLLDVAGGSLLIHLLALVILILLIFKLLGSI